MACTSNLAGENIPLHGAQRNFMERMLRTDPGEISTEIKTSFKPASYSSTWHPSVDNTRLPPVWRLGMLPYWLDMSRQEGELATLKHPIQSEAWRSWELAKLRKEPEPSCSKASSQVPRVPAGPNHYHFLPGQLAKVPVATENGANGDREQRVTIWNAVERRKLSGNAAPFKKNLEAYLAIHPVHLPLAHSCMHNQHDSCGNSMYRIGNFTQDRMKIFHARRNGSSQYQHQLRLRKQIAKLVAKPQVVTTIVKIVL